MPAVHATDPRAPGSFNGWNTAANQMSWQFNESGKEYWEAVSTPNNSGVNTYATGQNHEVYIADWGGGQWWGGGSSSGTSLPQTVTGLTNGGGNIAVSTAASAYHDTPGAFLFQFRFDAGSKDVVLKRASVQLVGSYNGWITTDSRAEMAKIDSTDTWVKYIYINSTADSAFKIIRGNAYDWFHWGWSSTTPQALPFSSVATRGNNPSNLVITFTETGVYRVTFNTVSALVTIAKVNNFVISQAVNRAGVIGTFVELWNPTSDTLNLNGYRLARRVSGGNAFTSLKSFGSTPVGPHSYYSIGWTGTTGTSENLAAMTNLNQDHMMVLRNGGSDYTSEIIDAVGFGTWAAPTTLHASELGYWRGSFNEGSGRAPNATDTSTSAMRLPGGVGGMHLDTQQNASNFALQKARIRTTTSFRTPYSTMALTTTPGSANAGDSFNLAMTVRDYYNSTVTTYTETCAVSVSAGSITPIQTGVFSAGVRNESFAITGTSGTCTITVTGVDGSFRGATTILIGADNESPTYTIATDSGRWYSSNPLLDVNFSDNAKLDTVWYQLNSYSGTWKTVTSDGSTTIGTSINNAAFTTDFRMQTADWNALAQGYHTIYFRARDQAANDTGISAATARGLGIRKDTTPPVLNVNRDSHTIKSDGAKYGALFDVDIADVGGSGIDSVYVTRSNGLDTATIFYRTCTTVQTANWALTNAFTATLANGHNVVYVRAQDTAGNISSAGTLYVNKEVINATDGDTSDWRADELLGVRKGTGLRVAWDDTSFFLSYEGVNGNLNDADIFLYLQTSSVTAADSSLTTINWGGMGTHTLPMGCNYAICIDNGAFVEFQKNTAGVWSKQNVPDSDVYGGHVGLKSTEYRVSWSAFGGKPSWMRAVFLHQYEGNSHLFNSLPMGNPAPENTSQTLTDHYYWPLIAETVAPNTAQIISNAGRIRTIDGDPSEWGSNEAATADTSLIRDSEFVWRAATGDMRTDAVDPDADFDLRRMRLIGDANNLYALFQFENMSTTGRPLIAIAIDTDLSSGSGEPAIGGTMQMNTVAAAEWELNSIISVTRTGFYVPGWTWNGVDANSYFHADNKTVEFSMPWSKIGTTPTARRLRLSVVISENDAGSAKQQGAWVVGNPRGLDGVTAGWAKGGVGANYSNEAADSVINYYFEVDFDTSGGVVLNKFNITAPTETATVDTFRITLQAVDFNGNAVTQYSGGNLAFTHTGGGTLTVVDSTAWSSGAKTVDLRYSRSETITITATESLWGKQGSCTTFFRAYPVVKLTEVAMAFGNGQSDSDYVEMYMVDDRNDSQGSALTGWTLHVDGGGAKYTFGAFPVRTRSLVVVSFSSSGVTSDTNDVGDSLIIVTGANPSDGAGGIALSNKVVDIRNAAGTRQDAVYFSTGGISGEAANTVAAGMWDDAAAGGAVSLSGVVANDIRGISRETPVVDNNTKGDWRVDTLSKSSFPLHRFTVTSDSASPYYGDSFNLTIRALDWRGMRCSYFVGSVSLTASGGRTIVPAVANFIRGTGETTIAVALLGASGATTVAASCMTVFGGASGETSVNLQQKMNRFDLVAWDPNLIDSSPTVRRGTAFKLRIRAVDSVGDTMAYTGAVTLTAAGGTISPPSVTFISGWLGETTMNVTLSGDSAIGRDTITATSGSFTGRTVVVPLADNRFVINEVLPADVNTATNDDRDEWVEIRNRSTGALSTNGWILTDYDGSDINLPDISIPSGKFLVVHFREPGTTDATFTDTDGAAHFFPYSTTSNRLSYHQEEAGLYSSTTKDSRTVASYVSWANAASWNAGQMEDDAVGAALWVNDAVINHGAASANALAGRSLFRIVDGCDSERSPSDWALRAASDTYTFTEGFANTLFDSDLTGVSITLRSYGGSTDTVAVGETLVVILTATGGGNPAVIGVTTVILKSNTDSQGIVLTLVESTSGSRTYIQEALIVMHSDSGSRDGSRWLGTSLTDTVTATWVRGGADAIAAVPAPLNNFGLSAPSAISNGYAFSLTITARTATGLTKVDYTGTVNLTSTPGAISPTSVTFAASDSGSKTVAVMITGATAGATDTITATEATTGETGRVVIDVVAAANVVINEIQPAPQSVDWDRSGVINDNGNDEWYEIFNRSSETVGLASWRLGRTDATGILLSDSIPPRGYITVYRRTGGPPWGLGYIFDSAGVFIKTVSYGGNSPLEAVNTGGVFVLKNAAGIVIDTVTYPSMNSNRDSSYQRAWDGANLFRIGRPSPGETPAAAPWNDTSPNIRFRLNRPDTASLNETVTLIIVAVDAAGETVTDFTASGVAVTASGGPTLSISTLTFTSGICSTAVKFLTATGTATLTIRHETNSWGRGAVLVVSSTAEVTLSKSLYAVTLGGAASPPIPGASIWYQLTYNNLGPANADTTIIRDSIALTTTLCSASRQSETLGASATFNDSFPASGWQFQYSTSASPDQADTSADYVAGWPTPAVLPNVRWIRWRRSSVPNGQTATIRFRVILR